MSSIYLLPEYLQRKSLSKYEIVLIYEDALQALDILEGVGWAVGKWEPWLKLPDGSHVHPIMGGNFNQTATEDWATYVHRAAQLCRNVMEEAQQEWKQGIFLSPDDPIAFYWQEKLPSMVLYFCLAGMKDE